MYTRTVRPFTKELWLRDAATACRLYQFRPNLAVCLPIPFFHTFTNCQGVSFSLHKNSSGTTAIATMLDSAVYPSSGCVSRNNVCANLARKNVVK